MSQTPVCSHPSCSVVQCPQKQKQTPLEVPVICWSMTVAMSLTSTRSLPRALKCSFRQPAVRAVICVVTSAASITARVKRLISVFTTTLIKISHLLPFILKSVATVNQGAKDDNRFVAVFQDSIPSIICPSGSTDCPSQSEHYARKNTWMPWPYITDHSSTAQCFC